MLRLAALLCVALAALTTATMYSCRGQHFRYVQPGSSLLLDSRGTRWSGRRCFNAYTSRGYQLVMDCSPSDRYFDTSRYCDTYANMFYFYPQNGRVVKGCGSSNTLQVKSDGYYFYTQFNNNWSWNYYNRGIKCNVRAEKPGETTTTAGPSTTTIGTTTTTTNTGTITTTLTTTTATATAAPKCTCGKHNKDESRIVNGQETKPNEYPFFAGLVRKIQGTTWRHIFCGGSLISATWVVSASHCVVYSAADTQVVLGGHDMDKTEASRQLIDVASIIKHEDYDSGSLKNDIALYKLAKAVTFTSQISPVCLPPTDYTDQLYGTNAIVMGYGHTSHGGSGTRVLHDVQLKLENYTDCQDRGGLYGRFVTKDNVCTLTKDKDSCQGDSGGPLVYDKNSRLTLIGVVSWGDGCAGEKKPGVYAKVENFIDWIHDKTSNTICRE